MSMSYKCFRFALLCNTVYINRKCVPISQPRDDQVLIFHATRYELIEAEKQKKDIRKIVLPSHNASAKPAVATSAAPSAKPKSPTSAANNNQSAAAAISSSSSSSPSKVQSEFQNNFAQPLCFHVMPL